MSLRFERRRRWALGLALVAVSLLLSGSEARAADSWVKKSWESYARKFVQADGRVIDPSVPPGITTSEGQSYVLMRAVWADDRTVFERVLNWTDNNLSSKDRKLPAWKWGQQTGGVWGVLDGHSAADADVLLASALLAGAQKWNKPDFAEKARALAMAIWEEEVRSIGGRRYLLPGNWAGDENPVPLNLSYYSPALFRRLAAADASHPWNELVSTTYDLLRVGLPATGLPPDWLLLQRATNELVVGSRDGSLKGRFGHDAYRVYLNLALDYVWDRSPAAQRYLESQKWLGDFLVLNGTLPREVGVDALPRLTGPEPLALYGALYPGLALFHRDASRQLRAKLDAAFQNGFWGAESDYYSQNLVWFGLALGDGFFPAFRAPAVEHAWGGGISAPGGR